MYIASNTIVIIEFYMCFKNMEEWWLLTDPRGQKIVKVIESSNMIKSRHNWWSTDTEVVQSRIHQKNIDRALSMKFHCPFQTR